MYLFPLLIACALVALAGITFLVALDRACRPCRHHDHLIPATSRSARR